MSDKTKAEKQFEKAVELYNEGRLKKAAKWYRRAAEKGHTTAQFKLGSMYENGQGVTKSYSQAVEWYRKAAEKGHAWAQLNLALRYANGQGVEQSHTEAEKWYRKAADQGYPIVEGVLEPIKASK